MKRREKLCCSVIVVCRLVVVMGGYPQPALSAISHTGPGGAPIGTAAQTEGEPLLPCIGGDFAFLAGRPAVPLLRLCRWLDAGVRFEGPWTPSETRLVLNTLDAFAANLGHDRFVTLVHTAVATGSGGNARHLIFRRAVEDGPLAAGWFERRGVVIVWPTLFTEQPLRARYWWRFLPTHYRLGISTLEVHQMTILAHELAHVLVDGLSAEYAAAGYGDLYLEARYVGAVPTPLWPHGDVRPSESVATELALYALGLPRPAQVRAFRATCLAPMLATSSWPSQLGPSLARSPAHAGR